MESRLPKGSPAPYFLEGGPTGCLLIHGFTGSPAEFYYVAGRLNGLGYAVHAPLLAGHGTSPDQMERTSWRDWLASAEDGYRLMAGRADRVHVMGLSMGALLAIDIASRFPVSSLVTFAPPIFLKNRRARLAPIIRLFRRYQGKPPSRTPLTDVLWGYDRTPLSCMGGLLHLTGRAKRALRAIDVPTLVVQGLRDRTVQPRSAEFVYAHVAGPVRQLAFFQQSGHVITADIEHDAVIDRVLEFIRAAESLAASR